MINEFIQERLQDVAVDAKWRESLLYVLLGGKQVRGRLAFEAFCQRGAGRQSALYVAAALEAMHAYSLVHDDLPEMDNADFRRHKPSAHKAFGHCWAVLLGDALQALAFQWLAESGLHNLTAMLRLLAKAVGPEGMVYGQLLDTCLSCESLELVQRRDALKTGRLLACCLLLPCLEEADVEADFQALSVAMGMNYQLLDDWRDRQASFATLGKEPGVDEALSRATALTHVTNAGIDSMMKRHWQVIVDYVQRHFAKPELLSDMIEPLMRQMHAN